MAVVNADYEFFMADIGTNNGCQMVELYKTQNSIISLREHFA
jgi:hypothetical protein